MPLTISRIMILSNCAVREADFFFIDDMILAALFLAVYRYASIKFAET
jgi:hypothetical protein